MDGGAVNRAAHPRASWPHSCQQVSYIDHSLRLGKAERCDRCSVQFGTPSVQFGTLEEPGAISRLDTHAHRPAISRHLQRNFAARRATRPYPPPEAGKAAHVIVPNGDNPISRLQSGLARRAALGEPRDDDRVLDFGSIESEPGSHRAIWPAIG